MGYAAGRLDVAIPDVGDDADTRLYQSSEQQKRSTSRAGLLNG
jgi:hypothetical protein